MHGKCIFYRTVKAYTWGLVQGFKEIGSEEWDGVIDRDYVKHRSQKVVAKRENANKSRPATANGKKQHA